MQIHLLFNTLLSDVTHSKHHVYGTAGKAEATLGFRQVAPRDAGGESVEEDVSQDFFPAIESREMPLSLLLSDVAHLFLLSVTMVAFRKSAGIHFSSQMDTFLTSATPGDRPRSSSRRS